MRWYAKVVSGLVVAFTALGASTAAAAPGDLDTSFAGTGKLTFAPGGRTAQITDVAIQPDGKIVLAGWVDQGGGNIDFLVSRLNPGGSFDQGFGSGGIKTVDFPGKGGLTADIGSGVALQPDGKIVVAGTSTSSDSTRAAVARLEPNGDPDGSFGGETTDAGAPVAGIRLLQNAHGNDVALDASGRILVAGTTVGGAGSDMYVARLTSSGGRDGTFNAPKNDYFMTIDFAGEDGATRMAVQPDGKIVLVGWSLTNDIGVARVIPGGVLDQDFASGGKKGGFGIGGPGDDASQANDVALEQDGRIDFAGYAGGTPSDMLVWRLAANGKDDDSLNGFSYALTDFGGADAADAIALQANGKILLAGAVTNDIGLLRLQPGGLPDATFGPDGKRTVIFPGAQSEAYSMALQPDGKIVLAGYAGSAAAVVRLQGDTSGGGPAGPGGPGGPSGPNTAGRAPRMSKFTAKVKSGGRSVSFVLRSDENCTGVVSGKTVKAYAAAKKRRVSLGSVRFKLTAGKSKTVVLKLSRKARKLLGRRHSLRVQFTVTLTNSAKQRGVSRRTLTLRTK